ncbi:uncharacterized SAM-binding protein YcdF (DUF218 family) [Angulomicrobium tetraedrale]|uniref:Uncharacterized SAM-binding protein YcdF (DUF218 family) n=1 Tax=Ancylobacter tetraedralis TaxID=217068 RepID=A0A839Z8L9_9HYPH|nr:YdcF family protein [Ancylobacter tetraedralis]MBB3771116.1 uncharacterized SAM-binding protein YcdF (DUF218 family) [Ancylobacter tetraedralis]
MFFAASKLFWMVSVPSTLLTMIALAGLLVLARWRRAGAVLTSIGVIGLVLAGLGPFGRLLTVPLEQRFPTFVDDGRPVEGVIVLGGAELPGITAARGQPAFQESAERMFALADLSRRYPQARLLFSGGSGALIPAALQEADVVRMALPQLGVDPARVAFETRSRNTAENARFSRALAQPKPGERWLLVTSALHMPRAMGCFRAAGFPVVAYPVDFRTTGQAPWWQPFDSVAQGLDFFDTALRQWIGLAAYYWTGRTDALFPAP